MSTKEQALKYRRNNKLKLSLKRSFESKEAKATIKKMFGGCCKLCGYNRCMRALQFHHLDPKQKKFNLNASNRSFKQRIEEAGKCILVCANCHCEIEEGILTVPIRACARS